MITFLDGPAAGQTLTLQRTPVLLRVVHVGENVDALDQLDDLASSNESITVYRMTDAPSHCHVDYRDPKTGRRRGEWRRMATYAVLPEQPDDATLRDNEAWKAWCRANFDRVAPEWAKGRSVMP